MLDPQEKRLYLFGIQLDALTLTDLIDVLERGRGTSGHTLILNHNLHSLYLYCTDSKFATAYRPASLVYVDGMPVVWLGKLAGLPLTPQHRITFLECFQAILHEASLRKWRVFYLGSQQQTLTRGLAMLREQNPTLILEGHHGFFLREPGGSEAVIRMINDFAPDVLFVGMGMPLQEIWLAQHLDSLRAGSVLTSGATLDYITGDAYRPPKWAGALGLYGVFRLLSDPKRLWKRYLVEPLYLLGKFGPRLIRRRFSGR